MPFQFPRRAAGSHAATAAFSSHALAIGASVMLAACGGGAGDDAATASQATPPTLAAAADGPAVQAAAVTPGESLAGAATDPTGWTTISREGERFTVTGTQTVRYGANDAWITMPVTNGADCSNTAFGGDPLYGVVKSCQLATAADTNVWTRIAGEGQQYTVNGTQTVRYGAGTAWAVASVNGGGDCSNGAFGRDPVVGVVKECQLASTAADTTTWTTIAGEGAAFSVSGTQNVRYGQGSAWITRAVTGSGTCSNGYFGNDPIVGVVKVCQVASGVTPPPPPVSPPTTAGVCTPPAAPVDTSGTAATVGNGTPASCTAAALQAAVNAYPVVTFNCGATPVVIAVTTTIDVPPTKNTVIDGGNKVTLDGGGSARILSMVLSNYRTNRNGLTLQHIALKNAKAPGTGYVAPNPSNSRCAYGYAGGGGGAILVRDARLHVFDVEFSNNAAATPGPDIGGGAIYAMGALDVLVSGSRFSGNSGSNSGAIGMLQTDLRVYNSSFTGNTANGVGQNFQDASVASCPGVGQPGQGGAGGNAGAIGIDGSDDADVTVCGATFSANRANELAGALARTANSAPRRLTIDRSAFQGNTAKQGGALFISNAAPLDLLASTFSGNQATLIGAAQFERSQLNLVNSTFAANIATKGLAGALFLSGSSASSTIRNTTFAGNRAQGGQGYFSAAIFGDSNFPITNTVFANNTTDDPWNPMQCGFNSAPGANDLQWPRTRSAGGANDTLCVVGIAFADPLLGALAANGGPTLTLAPAASSPLRGAGRNCPATDQRGNPRNTAICTIGAVE